MGDSFYVLDAGSAVSKSRDSGTQHLGTGRLSDCLLGSAPGHSHQSEDEMNAYPFSRLGNVSGPPWVLNTIARDHLT